MATFKCDGNPHDSLDELLEEYDEPVAYRKYIQDDCGNELTVSGKTGMGHVGIVGEEVWCDECGKHYTAAQTRAKFREQNS